MAEHLTVDQVVVGSTPITHPKYYAKSPFCWIKKAIFVTFPIIAQLLFHILLFVREKTIQYCDVISSIIFYVLAWKMGI